jgi:UDP-N-acetylmuramate: L-alanyl-gamma-D-glutamyl-meso-diaminopimelate ligase
VISASLSLSGNSPRDASAADSLRGADRVFVYQSPEVRWDVGEALQPLGALVEVHEDLDRLTAALVSESRPGDRLVLMSNGAFGGLHERLLAALAARAQGAGRG